MCDAVPRGVVARQGDAVTPHGEHVGRRVGGVMARCRGARASPRCACVVERPSGGQAHCERTRSHLRRDGRLVLNCGKRMMDAGRGGHEQDRQLLI
eukprot:6638279-Prymnesium_polylepis.1